MYQTKKPATPKRITPARMPPTMPPIAPADSPLELCVVVGAAVDVVADVIEAIPAPGEDVYNDVTKSLKVAVVVGNSVSQMLRALLMSVAPGAAADIKHALQAGPATSIVGQKQ